ncbi:hypothetical protein SpCBS45565_g02084 [Spizellomyces sp. 'palustris']|nr:hypothetical protein SpCBS45565_g02084 [Spizellomyces sp. 'palustris']
MPAPPVPANPQFSNPQPQHHSQQQHTPTRTNVLQLPQITKELASLERSVAEAKAASLKEERTLVDAQRLAIQEIERTAHEEEQFLEGVELERGEEEQEVLLHGAVDELLRHGVTDVAGRLPIGLGQTNQKVDDAGKQAWQQQTSQLYRTSGHLPQRFEKPGNASVYHSSLHSPMLNILLMFAALWRYEIQRSHPLYTTTAGDYGKLHPTIHEMPTAFHGQSSKFSKHLNQAGPYRNCSLNIK